MSPTSYRTAPPRVMSTLIYPSSPTVSTSVYEQRREYRCKNAILIIPPLRSGSPNGYFLSSPLHSRLIPCELTFDLPFAEVACSDALPRPVFPNTRRHSLRRHVRSWSPSSALPIYRSEDTLRPIFEIRVQSFHVIHFIQGCFLFPPLHPRDRDEVLYRPELGITGNQDRPVFDVGCQGETVRE